MEYLENGQRPNITSTTVFVAMSFSPRLTHIYEQAIEPAVLSCGYRALRVDYEEHNEDIVHKILSGIRAARFVVADFTDHKNGVYFEAGFARGLNIPVIQSCKKDDLLPGDKSKGLHFDLNHINTIEWNTEEDLRERLKTRIGSVIGLGPIKPEPAGT